MIVVDDRLLFDVLSGTETAEFLSMPPVESRQRSRGITGFREHSQRGAWMVR